MPIQQPRRTIQMGRTVFSISIVFSRTKFSCFSLLSFPICEYNSGYSALYWLYTATGPTKLPTYKAEAKATVTMSRYVRLTDCYR
jgi:hypothetical protein